MRTRTGLPLLELLSQGSLRLIYELRDELHNDQELAERVPSRPDVLVAVRGGADESIGALQQGSVTAFERLELISPPHSRVLETMLQEHCEAPDASTPFVAAIHADHHLKMSGGSLSTVDGLVKHVDPRAELGTHVPRLSSTGWPAEAGCWRLSGSGAACARALLQDQELLKIGAQLKAAGSEPLVDAEVIAARLWVRCTSSTPRCSRLLRGRQADSSVAAGGSGSGYSSDEYARQRAEGQATGRGADAL